MTPSQDEAKGKGEEENETKPICSDCLTDNGCPRGDQCKYRHPVRVGRRLCCGSTGHQRSSCCRPSRDTTPKAAAKFAAGPKARAKPKGKPKPKPKPKAAPKKGANAAWAEGLDQGTTVTIEEGIRRVHFSRLFSRLSTTLHKHQQLHQSLWSVLLSSIQVPQIAFSP